MLITFLPLLFRLIAGENGRRDERRQPLGFDNDRT